MSALTPKIKELASEWNFNIEAMESDLAAGNTTLDQLYDYLMDEIYGDGGLAGN